MVRRSAPAGLDGVSQEPVGLAEHLEVGERSARCALSGWGVVAQTAGSYSRGSTGSLSSASTALGNL